MQVRSKSCEHYGHKTITNPRVCEDAALILGLEAPTILEVPQSGISGVSMQSVSECNQHCGRQISQPLVKTLLDITDMDTRCDESMYKIADEAGETACVKHNCNYMTSKAVYSDCAPVDRRNYTVITSGTCASAGFADILSEAECDLAAVDGAHSGNTYDSGRAPFVTMQMVIHFGILSRVTTHALKSIPVCAMMSNGRGCSDLTSVAVEVTLLSQMSRRAAVLACTISMIRTPSARIVFVTKANTSLLATMPKFTLIRARIMDSTR